MPTATISISVDPGNIIEASDQLGRQIERLAVGRKRITAIRFPARFASRLGIAERDGIAVYRGHPAFPNHDVPYSIIIEHED